MPSSAPGPGCIQLPDGPTMFPSPIKEYFDIAVKAPSHRNPDQIVPSQKLLTREAVMIGTISANALEYLYSKFGENIPAALRKPPVISLLKGRHIRNIFIGRPEISYLFYNGICTVSWAHKREIKRRHPHLALFLDHCFDPERKEPAYYATYPKLFRDLEEHKKREMTKRILSLLKEVKERERTF